jgi:hypothetical protein
MSEPEPVDKILKKIKKKWEADKENWSILGSTDKEGNEELIISQAPNSYWLKMKSISAHNKMAYGKELKNIDDEIMKNHLSYPINSQKEMLRLFGMMVPTSKKDVLYTSGVELHSPVKRDIQVMKIEDKETNADKDFRKYMRNRWRKEQPERDGLYL